MKLVILIISMISTAFAAGKLDCKSVDSSLTLAGTDSGNSITVNSLMLYGTELLKNDGTFKISQIYNSDRVFDLGVINSKLGSSVVNIETIKTENIEIGQGFISSGLVFIAGTKDVKSVNCTFEF